MVKLRDFSFLDEAYIVKGMLESNGIPGVVQENSLYSVYPTPYAGQPAATLYVPDDLAEKAEKLLSLHDEG